jgi:hypothetical protein
MLLKYKLINIHIANVLFMCLKPSELRYIYENFVPDIGISKPKILHKRHHVYYNNVNNAIIPNYLQILGKISLCKAFIPIISFYKYNFYDTKTSLLIYIF